MTTIDRAGVNRKYQAEAIRLEAERQTAASKSNIVGYISSGTGLLAFVLIIAVVSLIYVLGA